MAVGQSRPAQSHRIDKPGSMHRNHIFISFGNKHIIFFPYHRHRTVESVQGSPFVIPVGCRRVDIFRNRSIFVTQPACSHPDQFSILVAHRKNNPVAHHLPFGRHLHRRHAHFKIQISRRKLRTPAGIRQQQFHKSRKILCWLFRLSFDSQPPCTGHHETRLTLSKSACRQFPDRVTQRTMFHLPDKLEYIPMFPASKTRISLFFGIHHQRRMVVRMKRTQPDIILPLRLQMLITADHLLDTNR